MPRFTLSPRGLLACLITACLAQSVAAADEPVAASAQTAANNAAVLQQLPFSDRTDYESVSKGLIAPFKGQIKEAAGKVIWDVQAYDFLAKDKNPDSINPSLWRLAQLSAHAGLFEVSPRLYQVRGLDLANMTIIEGDDGLIIIDPLTVTETAKAALELYYQNRPRKPVVAVIYSHTHVDHFGGVRGVVDEADVKAGKVKVFAPVGFMEHVMSENVFAGNAMSRRAQYQFGSLLPRGERGQVDAGLGKKLAERRHGHPDPAHRLDRKRAGDPHHCGPGCGIPADPGHRGAGGNEPVPAATAGLVHGGKRHADDAQHPHPAWRTSA